MRPIGACAHPELPVDGIDIEVDELAMRGVALERYPEFDRHAIAWFTDPAGNAPSVMRKN